MVFDAASCSFDIYLQEHQSIRKFFVPLYLFFIDIFIQLDSVLEFLNFDLYFICFVTDLHLHVVLVLQICFGILD